MLTNLRKVVLINPRFQIIFIAYNVLASALAIGVFYAANWYFFVRLKKMGEAVGLAPDHVFFTFLDQQRGMMSLIFVVTALVVFALLSAFGLFISHRVAGPIHRLHSHMLSIAQGQTNTEVKFRKGDFFPELANAFNVLLRSKK